MQQVALGLCDIDVAPGACGNLPTQNALEFLSDFDGFEKVGFENRFNRVAREFVARNMVISSTPHKCVFVPPVTVLSFLLPRPQASYPLEYLDRQCQCLLFSLTFCRHVSCGEI